MVLPELPQLPFIHTFIILSGLMIVRYFALAILFKSYIRIKQPQEISSLPVKNVRKDISWSILSTLVFAAVGTFVIELWHEGKLLIYGGNEYPSWYFLPSLLAYLFLHDTYFYWTHRWMHKVAFRQCHFAHHESRRPTAWTSFSFHPLEAIVQALVLPLLLLTIPIHWMALILFLLIMSIFGVTNHLGHEIYPSFLERKFFLITASHHQSHHEKINSNFGLYFTFWDILMGTEEKRRT